MNNLREAARALLEYFDSGNSVQVERATIRANAPEVIALRAALKAEAWQPIETAPKDGTRVLAYWGQIPSTYYNPANYGVTYFYRDRWMNPEDEDDYYTEPTHWIPLPAPPERSRDGS